MKIVEARTPQIGRTARPKPRSAASASFAHALDSSEAAGASVPAAPSQTAGSVLAAQEVDGEDRDHAAERRSAGSRGHDILDRLDALRAEILAGAVPAERLAGILASVRARRDRFTDPRLSQVLDEIDLRASVELAKLGRFPG